MSKREWPVEMTQSICSVFQVQYKKYGDRVFLMEKLGGMYKPRSWNQVAQQVQELSLGLVSLGVEPKDRVALMMTTQANWAVSDLAILHAAAVNVPIYPTVKAAQIAHIINDSGSAILIAGSPLLLKEVAEVWNNMPGLKTVIIPDGSREKALAGLSGLPGQVMEMQEVMALGRAFAAKNPGVFDERWRQVQKTDLASVLYTSGTTGNPKGVMLTHDNFLSNVRGGLERVPVYDHYVSLSFLPLSHVLERTAGYYMPLCVGSTIAYAEDLSTLPENLLEVRPHFMVSVPRVYERVYDRIMETVNSGSKIKKNIFYWARNVGRENARLLAEKKKPAGLFKLKYKIADRLVLKKIRDRFGGRLVFCISGGAPLGRELAEFFNGMGVRVLEGYGLTETSPIISFNTLEDIRYGSVGQVIPGGEVRIAEDGEILSKGPQNCLGYFNNPEATAELFDGEWLKTGDIGYLDKDGFLYITDRKKDIIVTSGGKNVAPQPLEGLLVSDRYIQQAVIQGDKKNYLVAMLVPNYEALEPFAREKGLRYNSRRELLDLPDVKELYAQRVAKDLRKHPTFEQVKKVYLKEDEFTLEAKELTPTLKTRRRFIFEKYKDIFDGMYTGSGNFIDINYR